MRKLFILLIRRVKRDRTWAVDPAVSLSALTQMMLGSAGKAIRGRVRRIGFRRARGLTFIGRHVTVRNKRYISVGRRLVLEDFVEIQGLSKRGITLGDRVTVGRYAMIRPTGYYSGQIGEGLVVGDNCTIGPFCYIGCSGFIRIGNNVMIAQRVSLYAENHNFAATDLPMKYQGVTHKPIVIEDDCWLAGHSIILAGVTVGRGSIVAAGSVVTHDVPPYSIVAGAPAHIIRSRLAQPGGDSSIHFPAQPMGEERFW